MTPPRRFPFRSLGELELPMIIGADGVSYLPPDYVHGVVDGLKLFGDVLLKNREAIRHDDVEPLAVVLELLAGLVADLEALEPVEVPV